MHSDFFHVSPFTSLEKSGFIFSHCKLRVDYFSNLSGNDDDDCIHIPGDNGNNHDHHKIIDHDSHQGHNISIAHHKFHQTYLSSYQVLYSTHCSLITSFWQEAFKLIISKMLGLLSTLKVWMMKNSDGMTHFCWWWLMVPFALSGCCYQWNAGDSLTITFYQALDWVSWNLSLAYLMKAT